MAASKGSKSGPKAYLPGAIIIIALLAVSLYVFFSSSAVVSPAGAPKATTYPTTTALATSTVTTTIPANIVSVPVTIHNNQAVASGSQFQQMIAINSSEYRAYITPTWDNVEFSTGPGGTGTVLQAWIESNATNTANETIVWVNLPDGLQPGNTSIFMDFMRTPVLSSAGPTGEAPQLQCPNQNATASCAEYGRYDDGARVFNFYDNFAGVSLNSTKWSSPYGQNATYNISNGISVRQEPRESRGSSPLLYANSYQVGSAGGVVDFYGLMNITTLNGGIDNLAGAGIVNATNDSVSAALIGAVGAFPGIFGLIVQNSTGIFNGTAGLVVPDPEYSVYSISIPPGSHSGLPVQSVNATQGYSQYLGVAMYNTLPSMPQQIGFIDQRYANGFGPILWIRERSYPPGGVMPEAVVGQVP